MKRKSNIWQYERLRPVRRCQHRKNPKSLKLPPTSSIASRCNLAEDTPCETAIYGKRSRRAFVMQTGSHRQTQWVQTNGNRAMARPEATALSVACGVRCSARHALQRYGPDDRCPWDHSHG